MRLHEGHERTDQHSGVPLRLVLQLLFDYDTEST